MRQIIDGEAGRMGFSLPINRYLLGADSSVAMSVNTPATLAFFIEYRWDKYRMAAPDSPSGPPNGRYSG